MKVALASAFDIKYLGKLNYFLEIKIEQNSNNSIWIGQPAYIENLLVTLGMQDCTPMKTLVSVGNKFIKATEQDECVDQKQYQSAVGSLMYLAKSTCTRPDISNSVGSLARFNSKPRKERWIALKRVLRCRNHELWRNTNTSVQRQTNGPLPLQETHHSMEEPSTLTSDITVSEKRYLKEL